MQGGTYTADKALCMVYSQIESLHSNPSQKKPPIILKPADLQSSLEYYAKNVNEFRFYKEMLSSLWSSKSLGHFMTLRKAAITLKRLSNHPGLQMDKVLLGMEDWSGLVVRILSNHGNANQILVQFQNNLERLCKENSAIKLMKENITRVTLTTVIECLIISLNKQTKYFDQTGKHILEERINLSATPDKSKNKDSGPQKEKITYLEQSEKSISKQSPPEYPLKLATTMLSPVKKQPRQSSKEHLNSHKPHLSDHRKEKDTIEYLMEKK